VTGPIDAPAPAAPLTRQALAELDAHWERAGASYGTSRAALTRASQLEGAVLDACALESGRVPTSIDAVRRWLFD
jgi:hypothetical protein